MGKYEIFKIDLKLILTKTWHYVLITDLKIDILDNGVPTSLSTRCAQKDYLLL